MQYGMGLTDWSLLTCAPLTSFTSHAVHAHLLSSCIALLEVRTCLVRQCANHSRLQQLACASSPPSICARITSGRVDAS